jgi:hypothetical protein
MPRWTLKYGDDGQGFSDSRRLRLRRRKRQNFRLHISRVQRRALDHFNYVSRPLYVLLSSFQQSLFDSNDRAGAIIYICPSVLTPPLDNAREPIPGLCPVTRTLAQRRPPYKIPC